jgi:hypothetical protein
VTFTLYGPISGTVTSSSCSTAPVAFTVTVSTSDNPLLPTLAHYSSGNTTAGGPGTYAWVAAYLGNASNTPVTSGCTDELVTVTGGGLIAPTNTTCQNFIGSSPENPSFDLDAIHYAVSGGVIQQSINPGVFFYYSTFTAPSTLTKGLPFTVNIAQTNDHAPPGQPASSIYNFGVAGAPGTQQVSVFNGDCSSITNATASISLSGTNSSQVAVTFTPTSNQINLAGQTFVIGVKFSPKSIVGAAAPSPSTVNYTFNTLIGTTVVATDAGGVQLVTP